MYIDLEDSSDEESNRNKKRKAKHHLENPNLKRLRRQLEEL